MFCDVMKLSEGEQELEQKIKQRVLDLAVADEVRGGQVMKKKYHVLFQMHMYISCACVFPENECIFIIWKNYKKKNVLKY